MEIRAHWPCSSLAGFICADVLCLVFRPECPCIRACLEEKGPNVLLLAPAPDIKGLPIRSGRAQDQRSVILVTPICRLLLGFPRAPVNHGVFISLPDL